MVELEIEAHVEWFIIESRWFYYLCTKKKQRQKKPVPLRFSVSEKSINVLIVVPLFPSLYGENKHTVTIIEPKSVMQVCDCVFTWGCFFISQTHVLSFLSIPHPPPLFSVSRMKMRRHRVFLLCTVGLCVISFLHYYKALHYVSLLHELSPPNPNIKSFIMVTGFFWREKGVAATPLSPASPEEAPPLPGLRQADAKARGSVPGAAGGGGDGDGAGGGGAGGGAGAGGLVPGIQEIVAGGPGIVGRAGLEIRLRKEPAAPEPQEKPEENQQGDAANEVRWVKFTGH